MNEVGIGVVTGIARRGLRFGIVIEAEAGGFAARFGFAGGESWSG